MNKKGVELAVSSMVIIILAIIVLAILAIGFATGWGKAWTKIDILSGDVKETAIDACKLACAKQSKYAFCEEERIIDSSGNKGVCNAVGETCPDITCVPK